jgi:uncharacterized protein involved in type VI secretion and phage assembly
MDRDVLNSLFAPSGAENRIYGVVVGVVSNNKDPQSLGRVKVNFPWLSDTDESHWARIVTPMAGKTMGLFLLPEVGDEVMVAFEHGRMEFPYIVGSVWNGKDTPPETNSDGKNNLRFLKSRSGHIVRLDDTDGNEKVEILDKTGKNTIVIDVASNTITVTSEAKINITAKQDIAITSSGGKVAIEGNTVEITGKTGVKVTSNANMDANATGQLTLKGAMVNIN